MTSMCNPSAKITIRALVAVFALFLSARMTLAESAEQSIRQLLVGSFGKPEAPLAVGPVVVVGDHAIADWVQQGHGGRALLRQRDGTWSLILCSGDGIKSATALRRAGVPAPDAASLAERLQTAESTISPEERAMLSTFEGTVVMGDAFHRDH